MSLMKSVHAYNDYILILSIWVTKHLHIQSRNATTEIKIAAEHHNWRIRIDYLANDLFQECISTDNKDK